MTQSSLATVTAQCLCGAVNIRCTLPSQWVAHCHCSLCQRAHGAGVVTWVGFLAAQVEWRQIDSLRWYASSPGAERGFCGHCGSPMLFRSERWPGEVHVARALIQGELGLEPQVHVFVETQVPWLHLADDLPRKTPA
ncbi:GFA family protein [Ahniella affigens]|uniref:GFA family protein n=1 Tax=Ahniella affigens TaxID=2021234 RepID=A0A2P1PXS7_9GAMM|nr:GFA family protein [Ahniella affigens]AVP99653.1 GFA family protein [Ahniella affigens]